MNPVAHLLWAVVNSLWQSAVIALMAYGALRAARPNTAALRYAVWSVVLAATAVLPAINLFEPAPVVALPATSTYHVATTLALTNSAAAAPAAEALAVTKPVRLPAATHGTAPAGASAGSHAASLTFATTGSAGRVLSSESAPAPDRFAAWRTSAARAIAFLEPFANATIAAWAVLSSMLLIRLLVGFVRLRRIKLGLVRLDGVDIRNACARSSRPVTVGASAEVHCPCVIGYARPVIALPSELLRDLDRADLKRVLCHELGHIRRWDDWANLVQQVVRAVWFFNPVVQIACRALDVNREIACDDLVAAAPSDRIEYAKCLTEIARRSTFAEHLVPAAGFFPDRRQIVVRIEQLLDRNHAGSPRLGILPSLCAVVLLAAAFILARHQVPAFAMTPPAPPANPARIAVAAPPDQELTVVAPRAAAVRAAVTVRSVSALSPIPEGSALDVVVVRLHERPHAAEPLRLALAAAKNPYAAPTAAVAPVSGLEAAARLTSIAPIAAVDRLATAARHAHAATAGVHPALVASGDRSTPDDFLDALAGAGYTHLSVDDLIAVRNAGVTARYLIALRKDGVTPMPVAKLIALANAGVGADYIAALRGAGYDKLSADDLISLANAGVSPDLAQSMARMYRSRPSAADLVALANAGVTHAYVDQLIKAGYAGIGAQSLCALANAGVSSDFMAQMAKEGYAGMSVDTMIALANAGASPAYVRSLADAGYAHVSTNDLIRLANAGVTAKMIKALRSHGIGANGALSVDELIKLANEGF